MTWSNPYTIIIGRFYNKEKTFFDVKVFRKIFEMASFMTLFSHFWTDSENPRSVGQKFKIVGNDMAFIVCA